MAYRIEYDSGAGKYEIIPEKKSRLSLLTGAALGAFLLLTHLFWPGGDAVIRDFFIPGEDAVTIRAAQEMADNLRQGSSVQEAVEAFCREILSGTYVEN